MATNMHANNEATDCSHEGAILGNRTCREDPLACHLATALASAEDDDARYHLREALQHRLLEP